MFLLHLYQWYLPISTGDSRCVICGKDGTTKELSEDHKPESEVEKARVEKAGGKITKDGRINGGLNLARALGDHQYKNNTELAPEEQMISPMPDIVSHTITKWVYLFIHTPSYAPR